MRVLVTGTAGFIGFHVARRLLDLGHTVIGVDGMIPYYDLTLKRSRNAILEAYEAFSFHEILLEDMDALTAAWEASTPDVVIHLAAQAGVRYSLEHPRSYVQSNVVGSFNVLELARQNPLQHLLLASTSSIYGGNTDMPFGETDRADHQLTLYAASKKSMELMAHSYAHLWGIPTTAFRFFTVYGPWGRPDMAPFLFTQAIMEGRPIEIFNYGDMGRDFTFVDDLVEAVVRLIACAPERGVPVGPEDSLSPIGPFRIVNIAAGAPTPLLAFIDEIERATGRKAIRELRPMQPGDIERTYADATLLEALTNYRPSTPVSEGVPAFVDWFRSFYAVN